MGAALPGTDGRLGMGKDVSVFCLFFSLSFLSLACWSSFNLTLKGFLDVLGLVMMAGVVVGVSVATSDSVASATTEENTEDGLMEEEKRPELLNLARLKRPALARILELWLKMGVLAGPELAGVAIRVGFTLLRVRVATVVLAVLVGL